MDHEAAEKVANEEVFGPRHSKVPSISLNGDSISEFARFDDHGGQEPSISLSSCSEIEKSVSVSEEELLEQNHQKTVETVLGSLFDDPTSPTNRASMNKNRPALLSVPANTYQKQRPVSADHIGLSNSVSLEGLDRLSHRSMPNSPLLSSRSCESDSGLSSQIWSPLHDQEFSVNSNSSIAKGDSNESLHDSDKRNSASSNGGRRGSVPADMFIFSQQARRAASNEYQGILKFSTQSFIRSRSKEEILESQGILRASTPPQSIRKSRARHSASSAGGSPVTDSPVAQNKFSSSTSSPDLAFQLRSSRHAREISDQRVTPFSLKSNLQELVSKRLSHLSNAYTIKVVNVTTNFDPQAKFQGADNWESRVLSTLSIEACPVCLGNQPETRGADNEYVRRKVVLMTCKELGCDHALHASCLLSEQKGNLNLLRTHPTQMFRSTSHSPVDTRRMMRGNLHGCTMDLQVLHKLSNSCLLSVSDRSGVSSVSDSSGVEHVQISLKDSDKRLIHVLSGRLSLTMHSFSAGTSWSFEGVFDLRGQCDANWKLVELYLVDESRGTSAYITVEIMDSANRESSWRITQVRMQAGPQPSQRAPPQQGYSPSYGYNEDHAAAVFYPGHMQAVPYQDLPQQYAFVTPIIQAQQQAHSDRFNGSPRTFSPRTHRNSPSVPPNHNSSVWAAPGYVLPQGRGRPPSSASPRVIASSNNNKGSQQAAAMLAEGLEPLDPKRIAALGKTQVGSRHLQQKLAERNDSFVAMVFREVLKVAEHLMTDLFGNYLCQTLFDVCTTPQRIELLHHLQTKIPAISRDRQGTRAVQKLIVTCTTRDEQKLLVSSVRDKLLALSTDTHGSHVVHTLLEHFDADIKADVFVVCMQFTYELVVDQHGLCVVKKAVDVGSPEVVQRISVNVLSACGDLINHQYGNYMIQHLMGKNVPVFMEGIRQRLHQNYTKFSCQKFSSNVIEKCLQTGDAAWRHDIISELTAGGSTTISALLQDSFGNYVMQNALSVADTEQAVHLVSLIQPQLPFLRKNIRKKWERLLSSHPERQDGMPVDLMASMSFNPSQQQSSNRGGPRQRGRNRNRRHSARGFARHPRQYQH